MLLSERRVGDVSFGRWLSFSRIQPLFTEGWCSARISAQIYIHGCRATKQNSGPVRSYPTRCFSVATSWTLLATGTSRWWLQPTSPPVSLTKRRNSKHPEHKSWRKSRLEQRSSLDAGGGRRHLWSEACAYGRRPSASSAPSTAPPLSAPRRTRSPGTSRIGSNCCRSRRRDQGSAKPCATRVAWHRGRREPWKHPGLWEIG